MQLHFSGLCVLLTLLKATRPFESLSDSRSLAKQMLMNAKMTAMIVTWMEHVQTPLDPLNVFATMDTLETDAIVQVVIQTLR